MDDSAEIQNVEDKVIFGARVVNPSDPDVFDNADSARVRARQIGCIGIRRYNNRSGSASWMPCTNESDYRRVSGIGHSGRRFRRRQLEREVREIIGGRSGKRIQSKSANYTKPELRENIKKRIMAGSKGGQPGQWSARKAQLLAIAYRKAGGGYRGGKTQKQRSLSKWTKQKWRTSDGKPARRGGVTRRYLPASAWNNLTVGQRAATNRKKIQGSRAGNQFVANTEAARNARKRATRGQKHIEFYEDFEFKAVGPRIGKITRRRNFGSSSGGRLKRRVGGRLGGAFAIFDPKARDADGDNVVQENTTQERRIIPRIIEAAKRSTRAVADSLGRIRRRPQIDETRAFSRAERLADGRYSVNLPESLARPRKSPRVAKRGTSLPSRIDTTRKPTSKRRLRETVQESENLGQQNFVKKPKYVAEGIESIQDNRPEIYRQFITGESTIAELADKFDVVRDEIQQAVNSHKKFRSSNYNKFTSANPRLTNAINKFSNSRTAFTESIREGKFKDWDSMVQYVFRNPDSTKNRNNMIDDLFETFKSGKNPDRTSNMVLGYVRSAKANDKRLVKTFSDNRKPRLDFRPLDGFDNRPKLTSSSSDMAQRMPRSYRRDDLIAEAVSSKFTVSGKMSSPMTPKQEIEWKQKEWKRQQIKNFALDPNAATRYPSLKPIVSGLEITKAIEALDALDDNSLNSLWDSVVNDISAIPGASLPAYQAKQAPLSPRELALAATVKRPLVKAFLDEYKKFNSNGVIANLDASNMSDADIQSFFNTFILPELTNNGSPSIQDVEQAAQLLPSQARISDAERLLASIPSSFQTLEYRLKVGKKVVAEAGYDVDTPEFDTALQKFLDESSSMEIEKFNEDIQTWLNGGKPPKKIKRIAINPETGEPYTEQELGDEYDQTKEAIEFLLEQIDPELLEQRQQVEGVLRILADAKALETFLNDPSSVPDENAIPINVATGKRYTLREWIESGAFKLFRMYDNPATGKPFTDKELDETMDNLSGQIEKINEKIGPALMSDYGKLSSHLQKLEQAFIEAGFGDFDDDEEDNVGPPGDTLTDEEPPPAEEPPTIEEIQMQNQEILDAVAEMLSTKIDESIIFTEKNRKNIKDTIRRISGSREPTTSAPDTDEFWGQIAPDYNGDPNHPLNQVTSGGQPVDLNSPQFAVDKDLWNDYVASKEAQEWLDVHNTHTVAKYSDVPPEISQYHGDSSPGADPSRLDPRIRWDKFMSFLQKANPKLFRKNQKGEIVGETIDRIANKQGLSTYGGASHNDLIGVVDADGNLIDTSGYQIKQALIELRDEKIESDNKKYLSRTTAAAKERAKLWDLLSKGTFTDDEIAFQEGITNIGTVTAALDMYEVDNNISSAQRSNLDGVARQAALTRRPAFEKAQTEKLISQIRELARLGGASPRADSAELIELLDSASEVLTAKSEMIGREYDSFREETQMFHGQIASLLITRPGLFIADPKNPMQRNRFGQTGWNRAKEPLARYLNRIKKWNEDNIGYTDVRTGEFRPGIITQLVNLRRLRAQTLGVPAATSVTSSVKRGLDEEVARIKYFKQEITALSKVAKSRGISGFMKGGSLDRAEDMTRNAARRAASGRFSFGDPRILKRYDRLGFDVTKRMIGNASGFNKDFDAHIKEAIRNNNTSIENKPGFDDLNHYEKSFLRAIEATNKTQRLFGDEYQKETKRSAKGRVNQTSKLNLNKTPRFDKEFMSKPTRLFYRPGISGRMEYNNRQERIKKFGGKDRLSNDLLAVVPEQFGPEEWYLVNRHGEIMSPKKFKSEETATTGAYQLGRELREQKRGVEYPSNIPQWRAAQLGLRQSGYRSAGVHRQNVKDVAPFQLDGEKNKYIFAQDKKPKQRAGDILVTRKNAETGVLEVLVIDRAYGPHRIDGERTASLPGGMFEPKKGDTDLYSTALREANEEVGINAEDLISTTKLGRIDAPDWDPRFAEGIEVAAIMVEVSSTWEPKAADDADKAFFVPLTEIANGNVPLGFGHMAWLETAFVTSEDPELAALAQNFAVFNALSRQRQQRIIKEVNQLRREYNASIPKLETNLFDQENPQLKLFPENLPEIVDSGWQPINTDQEFIDRVTPLYKRVHEQVHGKYDEMSDAERKRKGLPPKKKRPPFFPPGAVSGNMRSALTEMGSNEFDRMRTLSDGRDNPETKQFINNVLNLRLTGMDTNSIASYMSDASALDFHLYGANGRSSFSGFSPTSELIHKIVTEQKLELNMANNKLASRIKSIEPYDSYTKQRVDTAKDVMSLAMEGLTTDEISDVLDISKNRTSMVLRRMGLQDKGGSSAPGGIKEAIAGYENSLGRRAVYVDSVYNRLSFSELASKYDIPESKAREYVEQYRNNVESLEPEHHKVYRNALLSIDKENLSKVQEQIVRMRLDGLSTKEISDSLQLKKNKVHAQELQALAKLRKATPGEFLGFDKELDVVRSRSLPSYEYATGSNNRFPQTAEDIKYIAARDKRDFRSKDKDLYLMNQHMGVSPSELAKSSNLTEEEVIARIDAHSAAIDATDNFKHKALRRALGTQNNQLQNFEIDFVNMRIDGASLEDMSRYFSMPAELLRAKQISIMTKLNNSNGISGFMMGAKDIDSRNLYEELSVDKFASQDEIDNAFLSDFPGLMKGAMRNDPQAISRLFNVSEAYKILSNPESRERYDDFDLSENVDLAQSDNYWRNFTQSFDAWPMAQYREPGTDRLRPTWVGDAIVGNYNTSNGFIKLPHHLGSDEITDDIDDGFLGFDINDSDKQIVISDMMYRKPVPGTKEWDALKRQGDLARASGDPRIGFDENGFVTSRNMSFIGIYDDPMNPNYIGDRFGGPPKGSNLARPMYESSSISGKMSYDKKKFPERPAPIGTDKGDRGLITPNGKINKNFIDAPYPLGEAILPTDDPMTVLEKVSNPDFLRLNDEHDEIASLLIDFLNYNYDANKDWPDSSASSEQSDIEELFEFGEVSDPGADIKRRYAAINKLIPKILDFLDGEENADEVEASLQTYVRSLPDWAEATRFGTTGDIDKVLAYLRKHRARIREYTPQPLGHDTVSDNEIRSYFEKVFPEGRTVEYTQRVFEQMRLLDMSPTDPSPMTWAYNHYIPMPVFVSAYKNYKNTGRMYQISGNMRSFAKQFRTSLRDADSRYPFDSKPTDADMKLIADASQKLQQTRLLPMAKFYDFEFSGPEGEQYNSGILTIAQRPVVVVRFYDKINVPFYMSSGRGGKRSVPVGKWYPFWGVGRDGWFNKTTEKDIKNYYGVPELRAAAERLNEILPPGSMPDENIKWNNGDDKWMPRSQMSNAQLLAERVNSLKRIESARKLASKEKLKFDSNEGYPLKESLVRLINGVQSGANRSDDQSELLKKILKKRKQFSEIRDDILQRAIADAKYQGTRPSNSWAQKVVNEMPDYVFNTTISGKMAINRRNWSTRNFYKELESDKNDSVEKLKKKYKELARRFHPDRNPGDNNAVAKFRAAAEAWEVLSVAETRADYDNNFFPDIERREQQANQGNRRNPIGFTSQRNQQSEPNTPPDETPPRRPTTPAPPRPPSPNPRKGASLPPLDKSLSDKLGFVPTPVSFDENLQDSMFKYRVDAKSKTGIDVPTTFGGSTVKVTDERFFDLYVKVASALVNSVTKDRPAGTPKRFISVGGAPGSGKTSMRKNQEANIPDVDAAVHIDADEIKTVIPEAVAAHANGDTQWATIVHEESRVISDMALRVAIDKDKDVVYDSTGQYNRGYETLKYARSKGYEIVMHYVVGPEELFQDRVKMRQLTDPRQMAGHIIPATMYRNFRIMPDMAKGSDEFYMWGWDNDKKVLFARKTKGGQLEILDSRAYEHGDFFKLVPDSPYLDRPDLSLFTRKPVESRHFAKWEHEALLMFTKDNKTVSQIATELKRDKESVFRLLTTKYKSQTNPAGGSPFGSPFTPRPPRKPDPNPRPVFQGEQQPRKSNSGILHDGETILPEWLEMKLIEDFGNALDPRLAKFDRINKVYKWDGEGLYGARRRASMSEEEYKQTFSGDPRLAKKTRGSWVVFGYEEFPMDDQEFIDEYGDDPRTIVRRNAQSTEWVYGLTGQIVDPFEDPTAYDYYGGPEESPFIDMGEEVPFPQSGNDIPVPGYRTGEPIRIPGNRTGEPIRIVGNSVPRSVDDPAPTMDRIPSSGFLAELRSNNKKIADIFQLREDSSNFRETVNKFYNYKIDDAELFDIFKNWGIQDLWFTVSQSNNSNYNGPERQLKEIFKIAKYGEKSLSDEEVAQIAQDTFSPQEIQELERAFEEMKQVGLPSTTSFNRTIAYVYSTSLDFTSSAYSKYNRRGTISGRMGTNNIPEIFGDPSKWKTIDDLDDELKDAMVDDDLFGKQIKHPLLFWLGPIPPNMIDYINNGLDQKRKALAAAEAEKNWSHYIFLHERPFRIDAFEDVMDELTDEQYWDLLSTIWVDSESIGAEPKRWLKLLNSNRGSRLSFMNQDEREDFDKLPDEFSVYRGYSSNDIEEFGMSWSTSSDVAEWFARRFARDNDDIILEELKVAKKDVFAYITRRGEEEIILDMRNAKKLMLNPQKQILPSDKNKKRGKNK